MKELTKELESSIRTDIERSQKSSLERFIGSVKSSMAHGGYDEIDLDDWDWVQEYDEFVQI